MLMPPLALATLLTCGVLILVLPKKYVIIPFLVGCILVSMRVRLYLGSLDFSSVRIIVVFALIRGFSHGEFKNVQITKIDKALLASTIVCGLVYTIREGTSEALVYRLGISFSSLGLFFTLRTYFDNLEDFRRTCVVLALLLAILGAGMAAESRIGRGLFTAMGSPASLGEREGGVRASGPFSHPSNAGIFTAAALPLMTCFVFRNRVFLILGAFGAIAATIASNSSGPAMALLYSIIGLFFWVMRKKMRFVRWLIVLGLITLDLVMKAPIWHLMSRAGGVTGGGGWHRAATIDAAIRYFKDWWLMGTSYTAHWLPYARTETEADITNQFIRDGVDGGLISVILLVIVVVYGFKGVGIGLRALTNSTVEKNLLVWGMGAALVSHVAAFFCTSYFDQVSVGWFLLLAMISSITANNFDFLEEQETTESQDQPTIQQASG